MERSYEFWGGPATAIVTGAASGLGYATANRLADEGYAVTAVDLDADRLTAAFAERTDGRIRTAACNVADADGAETLFADHLAQVGPVRVLVNCAGIAAPGATLRPDGPLSLDAFRLVLEVNVTGTFNFVRLAARQMQEAPGGVDNQHGVIVNTSSVAAFDGMVGQPAYAASKGAVAAMTLPLARELGRYGIRVMAIAPGVFSTPMVNGMPERSRDVVTALRPPFPDRLGEGHEYAELVSAIVSNRMLNGEVIRLDGGIRLPPR
ncbi:SDR family NAD(P)-dependent oxidoreductase [Rhodobacteraceae bacterium KMM 6894]|nr:SDR family NAD(P)-dependent oxidoreductase [Rhodobacteraceae bacterium KMM 6894]